MLFNSPVFLFVFLPITLAVYILIGRRHGAQQRPSRLALGWLVLSSLVYYGWWDWRYLFVIGLSLIVNYSLGRFLELPDKSRHLRWLVLALGIALNLVALGIFKYLDFAINNINAVTGWNWTLYHLALPIGISFFTFQQIAYLMDAHDQLTREHDFLQYVLFVTFFPQLIAGPIVHHKDMLPQFQLPNAGRASASDFSLGLTFLSFGLGKKILLADFAAQYVTPVFGAAAAGFKVNMVEAWVGSLAYAMQLYFDFSAYSDMAIGLGLLFAIRLPLNFASPYRAENIVDFWRRWHMTLSQFLRDYLYIPLGGNRRGAVRRYVNLFLTMLLGGIWHGAGWTFALWGALHGAYLMVNHGWVALRRRWGWWVAEPGQPAAVAPWWYRGAAWLVTFLAVLIGWVAFRAESLSVTLTLWRSLFDPRTLVLPQALAGVLKPLGLPAAHFGSYPNITNKEDLYLLLPLMLLAFLAPNSQEVLRYAPPGKEPPPCRAAGGTGKPHCPGPC